MKVLLRHLADAVVKETVELARIPSEGEEIHWPHRILKVYKTIHFPITGEDDEELCGCCYVSEA